MRWSGKRYTCCRSYTYHRHAFYSLHLPRWQPRFKNNFIVLENSKAKGHNHILRPQNPPAFQLDFDPGRVMSYDLNGRIQHDPETARIVGMVTELVNLFLGEALEPTLIYAKVVLLRKSARCGFECEVMCLGRRSPGNPSWEEIRDTYPRRSDPGCLFWRLRILEIECIVFCSHFLRGPGFRSDNRVSRPSGHIASVF